MNCKFLDKLFADLPAAIQERVDQAAKIIVNAKKNGGNIVTVIGSGPNLHEGITTLVAELIAQGVINGVLTSSATISHEMAGTLERVKRIDGTKLDFALQESNSYELPPPGTFFLPRGSVFEFSELSQTELTELQRDVTINEELWNKGSKLEGPVIIKAAGNMSYPLGLRTESIATRLRDVARKWQKPLEFVAGLGADPRTMIGSGANRAAPVLVTIPAMVGGGNVGISVGDSIPIAQRCQKIAYLLSNADVVIESALALAQEVHDGPFETYTGHGIWAPATGTPSYTLQGKHLIRIDLDPNLQTVWEQERAGGAVQAAINQGKPKTKMFKVPFRMEMSGFARLENSLPIIGDIGTIWPLMAVRIAEGLGLDLKFMSYPQETPDGQAMRDSIVRDVNFFHFEQLEKRLEECTCG